MLASGRGKSLKLRKKMTNKKHSELRDDDSSQLTGNVSSVQDSESQNNNELSEFNEDQSVSQQSYGMNRRVVGQRRTMPAQRSKFSNGGLIMKGTKG